MRRIVIALCTTATGLVLLFSWPTSLNRPVGGTATGVGSAASSAAVSGGSAGKGSGAPAAKATGTATYDGAPASTRYGEVQVRITVTNGSVTAADAIRYPDQSGQDQLINSYAIPILNEEAVSAQSAGINMVSGATVTSRGYLQSLQDALDQAAL